MTDADALDTTHPHHRKLRAVELQTAETRDLMIITAASELGILVGADRARAEEIVRRKLVALLSEETR